MELVQNLNKATEITFCNCFWGGGGFILSTTVPRSCERVAIQLLSACRTPGTGRTSQRNPVNE